jgi:hypothetical protein
MTCPTLISPVCKVVETGAGLGGAAQRSVVHTTLELFTKQISDAIASVVRTTITWWVKIPSVDVGSQPVIGELRRWFLPIAIAVTIAGLIAAGARMAAARKANPLIDVTGGLLIIAVTAAVGTLVPNLLLKAGDAWSTWVLNAGTGDQFAHRMTDILSLGAASPGFVLVIGVIVLVLTVIQAVLMLLRETAIVILVGMLPLAAAGAMSPGMRGWIKRVAAWLLALIFYKPAAAAVYATAFTMIGKGHGEREYLMGLCALALSLIALPVLIKFFTFATGSVAQHSGGGILGTAVGAMVAVGSLRTAGGGGGSAVAQADYTSSRIPPPSNGDRTDAGQPVPPSGGISGGTASATPSPSSSTAPGAAGAATETGAGTASAGATASGGATAASTASGAGGAAAGSTAAGASAAGATAAGTAAAGPAGAAVGAAVAAGQKVADGAKNAAGTSMTPDGSDQP